MPNFVVFVALLFVLADLLLGRGRKGDEADPYDTPPGEEAQVIIAGFGRFGQIVARILRAKGIVFTALETSQEQVAFAKKFGSKIKGESKARSMASLYQEKYEAKQRKKEEKELEDDTTKVTQKT